MERKAKRLFAMVKNEKGGVVKREERQLCGWVEGEKEGHETVSGRW